VKPTSTGPAVSAPTLRSLPHVALVVYDFNPSFGQGRYCVELVRRLRPEIAFSIHAASFEAPDWPGVRCIPVPAWRANVLTTIFSFMAAVGPTLKRAGPDLIHTQGLACWSADVITAHVCNAARRHHLAGQNFRARLFTRLIAPFERAFYQHRRAGQLIAISEVVRREVTAEYGWKRPCSVIHHGTDVERFRPATDAAERRALRRELGWPDEAWTWLFMGEAVKGLAKVLTQLPEFPEARLVVVSRSDMAPYRAQADALGVTTRVAFHGFDPRPERLHRAADVFVYPSDYDTFGMVVTEAMASGTPVVIGRNIGAAELVEDGRNGLLCDPADPDSLKHSLRALAADPAFGRRLGQAGRAAVERKTWDDCAAATLRVYEQALRGQARP